jgi:hypothetical protein
MAKIMHPYKSYYNSSSAECGQEGVNSQPADHGQKKTEDLDQTALEQLERKETAEDLPQDISNLLADCMPYGSLGMLLDYVPLYRIPRQPMEIWPVQFAKDCLGKTTGQVVADFLGGKIIPFQKNQDTEKLSTIDYAFSISAMTRRLHYVRDMSLHLPEHSPKIVRSWVDNVYLCTLTLTQIHRVRPSGVPNGITQHGPGYVALQVLFDFLETSESKENDKGQGKKYPIFSEKRCVEAKQTYEEMLSSGPCYTRKTLHLVKPFWDWCLKFSALLQYRSARDFSSLVGLEQLGVVPGYHTFRLSKRLLMKSVTQAEIDLVADYQHLKFQLYGMEENGIPILDVDLVEELMNFYQQNITSWDEQLSRSKIRIIPDAPNDYAQAGMNLHTDFIVESHDRNTHARNMQATQSLSWTRLAWG